MSNKVIITIKNTETAVIDVGDLPVDLVRDILVKNNGSFDGNWGIGDLGAKYEVDSVTVEALDPTLKSKAGK